MYHAKKGKKFGLIVNRRKSFLKNLANNLIRKGKIETTETRAKAIRPIVEKMVTLAKKQNLASRRLLISRLKSPVTAKKLYDVLAPKYQDRKGGYLRITKLGKARKRDGAKTATIEFV